MALYVVIALGEGEAAVDEAVSKVSPQPLSYKIESGKWVINSPANTAKQLGIDLGIREKVSHLIVSVKGYSGRGSPDLWEWWAKQSET